METFSFLLGCSKNQHCFARIESIPGDATLIWDWIIFSTPMNVGNQHIAINREMGDRAEGHSMFIFLDFLLVSKNCELAIMGTNLGGIRNNKLVLG